MASKGFLGKNLFVWNKSHMTTHIKSIKYTFNLLFICDTSKDSKLYYIYIELFVII